MWTLIAGLMPALINPILNHLDRRLESAGQSEARELERQKKIIETQRDLALSRERDWFGRLPVWIISTSAALYIAAVFVDSTFPMDWLTPLALPKPRGPDDLSIDWTWVLNTVIFSLFGLGAVDKIVRKR